MPITVEYSSLQFSASKSSWPDNTAVAVFRG